MVAGLTADVFVQLTATLAHLSSTLNKTNSGPQGGLRGPNGGLFPPFPPRNSNNYGDGSLRGRREPLFYVRC